MDRKFKSNYLISFGFTKIQMKCSQLKYLKTKKHEESDKRNWYTDAGSFIIGEEAKDRAACALKWRVGARSTSRCCCLSLPSWTAVHY